LTLTEVEVAGMLVAGPGEVSWAHRPSAEAGPGLSRGFLRRRRVFGGLTRSPMVDCLGAGRRW